MELFKRSPVAMCDQWDQRDFHGGTCLLDDGIKQGSLLFIVQRSPTRRRHGTLHTYVQDLPDQFVTFVDLFRGQVVAFSTETEVVLLLAGYPTELGTGESYRVGRGRGYSDRHRHATEPPTVVANRLAIRV
ncbi:hypothetical protein D3C76_1276400 [compost metagenome]